MYLVRCDVCMEEYIGKTERPLIKEHKESVMKGNEKSTLTRLHTLETQGHTFDCTMLRWRTQQRYRKEIPPASARLSEAIHIRHKSLGITKTWE